MRYEDGSVGRSHGQPIFSTGVVVSRRHVEYESLLRARAAAAKTGVFGRRWHEARSQPHGDSSGARRVLLWNMVAKVMSRRSEEVTSLPLVMKG